MHNVYVQLLVERRWKYMVLSLLHEALSCGLARALHGRARVSVAGCPGRPLSFAVA